ncbi:hypothetical protein Tco_0713553, partial [Tanacetum coccineum]
LVLGIFCAILDELLEGINFSIIKVNCEKVKWGRRAIFGIKRICDFSHINQRVIGASALSLSLDVSNSRVRKIKVNISNHISALRGVFVPLSEPLSAAVLEGPEGTSGATPDTTTALSVTFASACIISPISTDDYEVTGAVIRQLRMGTLLMRMLTLFPM